MVITLLVLHEIRSFGHDAMVFATSWSSRHSCRIMFAKFLILHLLLLLLQLVVVNNAVPSPPFFVVVVDAFFVGVFCAIIDAGGCGTVRVSSED